MRTSSPAESTAVSGEQHTETPGSLANSRTRPSSPGFLPMMSGRSLTVAAAVTVALLITAVAIAIAVGVFKFWRAGASDGKAAHAPVLTVSVESAALKPVEREISVNGSISAWDPVSVGAEVSGLRVVSILVDEGARVKQGQVLAVLDSSVIRPQLQAEEARLRAAVAQVTKAVQPNRLEEIQALTAAAMQARANLSEQEAALVQAKANAENAAKNVGRYARLAREGAVSLQELETRQTNDKVYRAALSSADEHVKAAKFALDQADDRLAMARVGGRSEDVEVARANLDEIKANVERLKAQLAQTTVRSPVDGLITRRDAHLGDIATLGKTMFLLSRDCRLELRAEVPESDLSLIKPGDSVVVTSSLAQEKPIEGRVREISPLVDSATRLATVRIDVPGGARLKPGMYAQGRIKVGQHMALTVPVKSVVYRDDKTTVFVLAGDQVHARTVETGSRTLDAVEIKSGLDQKEQVAVAGAGFLKDGDYVAVSR